MNRSRVPCIITSNVLQQRDNARIRETTGRNQALKSGETKTSYSPSESPHKKHAPSLFLVYWLLLTAGSNRCPQTSWCQFSESKHLSQIRNSHGSLLNASSGSSAFQQHLIPNFNRIAERELSIMKVQQTEYIFSVEHENFCALTDILGARANDVRAE
jgi:hypothetical protein